MSEAMTLTVVISAMSVFIGIAAGWKGGRLHLHAQQRYGDWRHAIKEVPSAYRLARTAVMNAGKWFLEVFTVVAIVTAILWSVSKIS